MNLKVRVVFKKDRQQFVLRWNDPETGDEHQQKSSAATRADALKEAGELEANIREGRYDDTGRIVWAHARRRFEDEKLPQLRPTTGLKYRETLNEVERVLHPNRLTDIEASRVSVYQTKLRRRGIRPATIHSRLGHLKAFLNWCVEMGMLRESPRIKKPSMRGCGKLMRGRPLTDDEFGTMLEVTPVVVGEATASTWRHYLEGMWLSGLRRRESLDLWWDSEEALWIDLSGRRPMLCISAEYEKGGKDRRVPITPDFAEFLERTSIDQRTGQVFKLPTRDGEPGVLADWVGRVVSKIGRTAGIVVDPRGDRKYATLHDLRRSFAARWADRVPMHTLRELMRHASLETTMKYYVGQDAERSADTIWAVVESKKRDHDRDQGTEAS